MAAASTGSGSPPAPEDDLRDRYKAALEAKRSRPAGNPHAQASEAKHKEDSHRSGGKREFRRKSG